MRRSYLFCTLVLFCPTEKMSSESEIIFQIFPEPLDRLAILFSFSLDWRWDNSNALQMK